MWTFDNDHEDAEFDIGKQSLERVTTITKNITIVNMIITLSTVPVCAQNTYGTNTYRYSFRR